MFFMTRTFYLGVMISSKYFLQGQLNLNLQ